MEIFEYFNYNIYMKKVAPFIGVFLLIVLVPACKKAASGDSNGTVYFMVSEIRQAHRDSFILPLTDSQHIAAAEKIVNDINASTSLIVSARIARGSGDGKYLNKDLLNPGRVWSWHAVEFFGFVDVTAEIYDSWPTFVEGNLDFWLEQNQGIIGFWAYTVTRKVDISELQ